MKLFREIKQGEVWVSIQESGVWKHIVSNTNPDVLLWEEISDMQYIEDCNISNTTKNHLIDNYYIVDYIELKDIVRAIAEAKGGWGSLTTSEKYLIIKYYIYRDLNTDKTMFLMSEGYTQQQALQYLVKSWFKHNLYGSFIDSIYQRWKFAKFFLLMMCDKESVELELERADIELSLALMKDPGVVGSDYGDSNRKGIMNYFLSTGPYYENNGFLEGGIITYPGITKEMVIAQIVDIMINGNYDPTMCDSEK